MSFGSTLKSLRKKHCMTQEQLAQELSISPQAVSRWETGFAMPDISLLVPIAEIFEVTTDLLLGIEKEEVEFDLQTAQCYEGKGAFFEGLIALCLLGTVHSCELVEKILNLSFEDENYLDFHVVWLHALTTKARLLNAEGKYKESMDALRQAQFHAGELDKLDLWQFDFELQHTSKIFKGMACRTDPRYKPERYNLYSLNTAIIKNQGIIYTDEEHYQKLVEEIKATGAYCKA